MITEKVPISIELFIVVKIRPRLSSAAVSVGHLDAPSRGLSMLDELVVYGIRVLVEQLLRKVLDIEVAHTDCGGR